MKKVFFLLLFCTYYFTMVKAGTFTVTNTADNGSGSLRQCIIDANASSGADLINFNISGSGPHTIIVSSAALPAITEGIVINGGSQPGSWYGTNSGRNILIHIKSSLVNTNLFTINGSNISFELSGLSIGGIDGAGILVAHNSSVSSMHVWGCYFGTTENGSTANANKNDIYVEGNVSIDNLYIGINSDNNGAWRENNLFANSTLTSISILSPINTRGLIAGNSFGFEKNGSTPAKLAIEQVSNSGVIFINNSRNITIGTNADGMDDWAEQNFIGNADNNLSAAQRRYCNGIFVSNAQNIWISANYIGTQTSGLAAAANWGYGVLLINCNNVTIGHDSRIFSPSLTWLTTNVISNNELGGIYFENCVDLIIANNRIGLDKDGNHAFGNGNFSFYGEGEGVKGRGTNTRITIGTNGDNSADNAERNYICDNDGNGIDVVLTNSRISGNSIGVNVFNTVKGNQRKGLFISAGREVLVGADGNSTYDSYEANYIGGNGGDAANIQNCDKAIFSGNYVGSANNGLGTAMPNGGMGLYMKNCDSILIGGTGNSTHYLYQRNHFMSNLLDAVKLEDVNFSLIANNFVGVGPDGDMPRGNGGNGLEFNGCSGNIIGCNGDGINDHLERNIIANNNGHGVVINNFELGSVNPNWVSNNYIGVNSAGTGSNTSGNGGYGIYLRNAPKTLIGTNSNGTSDNLERNVITSNGRLDSYKDGIFVDASDSLKIKNNMIGISSWGAGSVGNKGNGILFVNSNYGIIGTEGDGIYDNGERNVISNNEASGISIGEGNGFKIANNYIGVASWGFQDWGNKLNGIELIRSNNNTIGTEGNNISDSEEKNVLGHNLNAAIYSNECSGNKIAFNYIGIGSDGSTVCGNRNGLVFNNSHSNLVGALANGISDFNETNVISANSGDAVILSGVNSYNNTFAGNYVGIGKWNAEEKPNLGAAVIIQGGAHDNLFGSNQDGIFDGEETNFIVANGKGVIIKDNGSVQNKFSRNAYYKNGGPAIDLGNFNGVSPNDGVVVVSGGNIELDYPIIVNPVFINSNQVNLTGYIGSCNSAFNVPGSLMNGNMMVEIYEADNSPADQDGFVSTAACGQIVAAHAEGRRYLGRFPSSGGVFNFTNVNTIHPITAATRITAITIDANGNTSEFGTSFTLRILNTKDLSYTATLSGANQVLIDLSTIQFATFNRIDIQRADEFGVFTTIATIKPNDGLKYIDYIGTSKTVKYRLLGYTGSGNYIYSDVKLVTASLEKSSIKLTQNKNSFTISQLNNKPILVEVFDVSGKRLFSTTQLMEKGDYNLTTFNKGILFVKTSFGNTVETFKVFNQ